jgi:hypothetical protein
MAADKMTEIEMILKRFIREQGEHNRKMDLFATSQEVANTKLSEDVEEVRRGLYGDPKNEVVGVIVKIKTMDTSVKALKAFKARAVYWGTGVLVGVNAAIYFIKEHVINK